MIYLSFLHRRLIAGSSINCPPGLRGPFLQNCFLGGQLPTVLVYGGVHPQCRTLRFPVGKIPVGPFLLPFDIPLNGSTRISHSFQCLSCRLAEDVPLCHHLVLRCRTDWHQIKKISSAVSLSVKTIISEGYKAGQV